MKAPNTSSQEHLSNENETYWRHHEDLLKSSELSRSEYCRTNKVNYDRFGYWLKKFSCEPVALVPIKLKEETETPIAMMSSHLCTLIFKNGHRLQIQDQKTLSIILERFG